MGKASAPVTFEAMLADQANRLSNNNYGTGFGGWSPTDGQSSMEDEVSFEGEKGNPFFTGTNRPSVSLKSGVSTNRAPFLWNGNNKSLRNVYQDAYNSYWSGVPQKTDSSFNQTWGGPEIRPTYSADNNFGLGSNSTGLQNLGTAKYWQDNNSNQVFNTETDDYLPEVAASNAVAQEGNQPEAALGASLVQPEEDPLLQQKTLGSMF